MKKRKCVTSCDIGKRKLNYKNCTYNSKKKKNKTVHKQVFIFKKKKTTKEKSCWHQTKDQISVM